VGGADKAVDVRRNTKELKRGFSYSMAVCTQ